ncbi:MAG: stimulus-sensing domain-containing protein [Alphaproteobacteria bacterium]|nr:stimulus-sensing domain-containing protein [Alphaproteobacteria bacterium]MDG1887109.1 stimulus-sensing domain-containing protein [Alphaproteobacteria bacterium]|tara:strand:+ start:716 stop:2392 length:1677 start_codon:yes stop_codon:yes gene_type:complete
MKSGRSANEVKRRLILSSEIKNRRFSSLTLRILAINTFAIILLAVGMIFYYDQYKNSLIQSELGALSQQAGLFSNAIAETAVINHENASHSLSKQLVQRIINRTALNLPTRSRIFDSLGNLLADSMTTSERARSVETKPLAPLTPNLFFKSFAEELYEHLFKILSQQQQHQIYKQTTLQLASEFPEVLQSLQGISIRTIKAKKTKGLILATAVPIQKYKQVVGALLLSIDGKKLEVSMQDRRLKLIGIWFLVSLITSSFSWYVARYITRPIQRLAAAAELIRNRSDRKSVIPDLSNRNDEIGDLARALRQMTTNLWQRMDATERFAADVSHEIKNPLTSIQSAVETASKVSEKSKRDTLFALVLDDVKRLDRLISDISAASRLDSELNREKTSAIDIKQMLTSFHDISISIKRFTPDKVKLKIINNDLAHIVDGYEDQLVRVIGNLVDNAETFSPKGKPIIIRCEVKQNHILITIEDRGGGIPETKLETVFNRFYSERPSDEKFGTHSGLGLSICKQIIAAHYGDIWAENIYSKDKEKIGAKLSVALPKSETLSLSNK